MKFSQPSLPLSLLHSLPFFFPPSVILSLASSVPPYLLPPSLPPSLPHPPSFPPFILPVSFHTSLLVLTTLGVCACCRFCSASAMFTVSSFYSTPQCSHCKRCTIYSNSVRLSVRLSHAGIVSKRLRVARRSLHCQIAKCISSFLETKKYSPGTTPFP